MRTARPTLAIASPILSIALFMALLTAAFSSTAQTSPAKAADCCGGTTTLAPASTTGTTTMATLATVTELSEFNKMIEMAGLRARLRRPTESVTVFAPTNATLAVLPERVKERLHDIGTPMVRTLVRTHMVEGILTPEQLTDGREIETLSGQKMRVSHDPDGTIVLDGVYRLRPVAQPTTNGIIYSVDPVIAPR